MTMRKIMNAAQIGFVTGAALFVGFSFMELTLEAITVYLHP